MAEKNYFSELNSINLNEVKEKKNGLDYISWAWAWGTVKKLHPDMTSKVYENDLGWPYFTDGHTCWVKVGVTVNGLEHIEYLPIMDYKNNSIPCDSVKSTDVNKSIQRAMVKAIARHGLGLYVYAGEDLPETDSEEEQTAKPAPAKTPAKAPAKKEEAKGSEVVILGTKEDYVQAFKAVGTDIGRVLLAYKYKTLEEMPIEKLAEAYQRKMRAVGGAK